MVQGELKVDLVLIASCFPKRDFASYQFWSQLGASGAPFGQPNATRNPPRVESDRKSSGHTWSSVQTGRCLSWRSSSTAILLYISCTGCSD